MSLPEGTKQFAIAVKYYLSSYRALIDAQAAILALKSEGTSFSSWKVQWAGICAILKSSVHLMRVDSKRCFSNELRDALISQYNRLRREKAEFPIFWQFIDRERHNILKEYDFSAYERYLNEEGEVIKSPGLLGMMDATRELRIRGGHNDGRLAIEVADEAAAWVEGYIFETIRLAGFDPDERIEWRNFLWERTKDRPGLASAATILASEP